MSWLVYTEQIMSDDIFVTFDCAIEYKKGEKDKKKLTKSSINFSYL